MFPLFTSAEYFFRQRLFVITIKIELLQFEFLVFSKFIKNELICNQHTILNN